MARIQPGNYTIRIPQRATLEEDFVLKAADEPVNLTGYTVLASIWKDEKRRVKIVDLTVEYLDRINGSIRISLDREQTRAIRTGGYWDLLVIEPSEKADYWLEGIVTVDIGLTDDE
jgi:hypothetical protein